MGGQTSSEIRLQDATEGLIINTQIIREIITLSYDEFLQKIKDVNKISKAFGDSSGTQLVFVIKKGSDSSILWKNTVRIGCIRADPETRKIISHRFLKLRQFLRLFNLLSNHVSASVTNTDASCSSERPNSDDETSVKQLSEQSSSANFKSHRSLTASFIFKRLDSMGDDGTDLVECCICMERKPDVTLPCTHSYCLPCIEQWNVTHKTCPICRENVNTDDSWVISEAPDSEEVRAEVIKALAGVVK